MQIKRDYVESRIKKIHHATLDDNGMHICVLSFDNGFVIRKEARSREVALELAMAQAKAHFTFCMLEKVHQSAKKGKNNGKSDTNTAAA